MIIDREQLHKMLKRVTLGGAINECCIRSSQVDSYILAQDVTGNIAMCSTAPVSFGEHTIGIGDIKILTKYLEMPSKDELSASVLDNRLVFSSGKSNFRYRLTLPEALNTVPKDDVTRDAIIEMQKIPTCLELLEESITQIVKFIRITECQSISIKLGSRGRTVVGAGAEFDHKFEHVLGTLPAALTPCEEIAISLNAKYLTAVLQVLDKDAPAVLYLLASVCIIVQDENYWVFYPIKEI